MITFVAEKSFAKIKGQQESITCYTISGFYENGNVFGESRQIIPAGGSWGVYEPLVRVLNKKILWSDFEQLNRLLHHDFKNEKFSLWRLIGKDKTCFMESIIEEGKIIQAKSLEYFNAMKGRKILYYNYEQKRAIYASYADGVHGHDYGNKNTMVAITRKQNICQDDINEIIDKGISCIENHKVDENYNHAIWDNRFFFSFHDIIE